MHNQSDAMTTLLFLGVLVVVVFRRTLYRYLGWALVALLILAVLTAGH